MNIDDIIYIIIVSSIRTKKHENHSNSIETSEVTRDAHPDLAHRLVVDLLDMPTCRLPQPPVHCSSRESLPARHDEEKEDLPAPHTVDAKLQKLWKMIQIEKR